MCWIDVLEISHNFIQHSYIIREQLNMLNLKLNYIHVKIALLKFIFLVTMFDEFVVVLKWYNLELFYGFLYLIDLTQMCLLDSFCVRRKQQIPIL